MFVKKISLQYFRNYSTTEIILNTNVNILIGKNAQGKTNLIEAVYLSLNGRTYKSATPEELVNWSSQTATITAVVSDRSTEKVN